jgi:hypothetical protein
MRRADNLPTLMSRFSRNLGASTSWNPQGLSDLLQGLLYLALLRSDIKEMVKSSYAKKVNACN